MNGDRNGQESEEEDRSTRIYQSRSEGIASSLKSQNANIKTHEVDEAIGRFIEAEGINTGNRSRTSTIKLKRSRYQASYVTRLSTKVRWISLRKPDCRRAQRPTWRLRQITACILQAAAVGLAK